MKQPFFIVGSGRCGSTLLFHLLEGHPRVALTNEARIADFLAFCTRYAAVPRGDTERFVIQREEELRGIVDGALVAQFGELFREHAVAMLLEFYERHFAHKQFTHWGDKLPWMLTTAAVSAVLPQTKFITLLRDPRDVVCSLRAFSGRDEVQNHNPNFAVDSVSSYAGHWNALYTEALRYLDHNLTVRYEDLVREPLATTRRVMDHLGLALTPADVARVERTPWLAPHATSASAETSIGRWRAELPAAEVAEVEATCGELMRRFGYDHGA